MSQLTTSARREVLADLPYLVAVDATGGVTAAADELGVPQPTVSRGLARLAERLGVPVLDRDGRGVRLSAEATALLPYAERALAALHDGLAAVERLTGERADAVSLAFQHTQGRIVVPALVRALRAEHPTARFDLHQGARDACLEALDSGAADAVIVSPALPATANVRTVHLYDEPLVLAVPPEHRLARRRRVRLQDIAAEPLLVMRTAFGLRLQVDDLLAEAGITPTIAFEGEDVQTLRGLVAAGLGVAVLPAAVPHPTDVVEVPIGEAHAIRRIGLSWRTDRRAGAAALALYDVVQHGDWLPRRR
ncbi:LysR family transcriptional regulator [Nocardioides sp. BP30]|uniref:LysR family transcriptional regulator n=1 Tax=Nocardioides sp. BP30 TaxID=3036374 RepID=UPI002468BB0A|nr:LysR family transcriptional regulator [Nocardioides sp. BP30]WGL50990.1 LysR family transcriptional regulator [Nocardioides sp. BP30]